MAHRASTATRPALACVGQGVRGLVSPRLPLAHTMTPHAELFWLGGIVFVLGLLAAFGVYFLVGKLQSYLRERQRQNELIAATVAKVLAFKAQDAVDPDADRTHVPPGIYGWQRDNGKRH